MKKKFVRSQALSVFVVAATVGAFAASPAAALSIVNKDKEENKVLVDEGQKETMKTIPAGKTVKLTDVCKDGCGITGPRGFTRMAKQGDNIVIKNGDVFGDSPSGS